MNAEIHLEKADSLFRDKDYLAAAGEMAMAAEESPERAEIWAAWGNMLFQSGKIGECVEKFQKATELEPENASHWVLLALAQYKDGNTDAFETALSSALALEPDNREALKLLGDLNFQHGSLSDAGQVYLRILQTNPEDVEVLLSLGICLFKGNEFEVAKDTFEKILEIEPDHELARNNLEACQIKLGLIAGGEKAGVDEAPSEESEALEMPGAEPSPAVDEGETAAGATAEYKEEVHRLLEEADFFNEVGNTDSAMTSLEEAASLAPKESKIISALGSIYFNLGKYEQAREQFRREIELKPRDADAYTRLAMAALMSDHVEEFESSIGLALEIEPEHKDALKFLAKINMQCERYLDAGRIYAKLLETEPENVDILLALAFCFFRGGDKETSKMVYERALRFDPDNEVAINNLDVIAGNAALDTLQEPEALHETPKTSEESDVLGERLAEAEEAFNDKDFDQARDCLKSALQVAPENVEVLSALGSLMFQLGELESAAEMFQRANSLAGNDPILWTQLALVELNRQNLPACEEALEKALELDPAHKEALKLKANKSFQKGEFRAAAETYNQLLKKNPDDVYLILAIGICFYKVGMHDSAKMMYERVIELDPQNEVALENLEALRRAGEGAGDSGAAIGEAPEEGGAKDSNWLVDQFLATAESHLRENNLEAAMEALKEAMAQAPDDADILAGVGSVQFQLGAFEPAREALLRAVQLKPESADFQTRAALACLKTDEIGLFESHLGTALNLDANYLPALQLLGDLNLKEGQYKNAAEIYNRILKNDPDNVAAMLPLAVCFYKTGDKEAAQMVYERILELDPGNEIAAENLKTVASQ